jgi:hypothetical protein
MKSPEGFSMPSPEKEKISFRIEEDEDSWIIHGKASTDEGRLMLAEATGWVAAQHELHSAIDYPDEGVAWYIKKSEWKEEGATRGDMEKVVEEIRKTRESQNIKEWFESWKEELETAKQEAKAFEERKKIFLEGLLNGVPAEKLEYPVHIIWEGIERYSSIKFWGAEDDPFTKALINRLEDLLPAFAYGVSRKTVKEATREAIPIFTKFDWYDHSSDLLHLNKTDFQKSLTADLYDEWKKRYLSNRAGKRELRQMLGLSAKEEKGG